MARMVPSYISEDTKSPGEKALFHKFREDPGTSGWIVLHSLGVAKHKDRISGELDFVVIIPGEGVLCIEVKAGNVARKEGYWLYGSGEKPKKSVLGPFRQASDAMHSIREHIAKEDPSLNRLLFISSVFFTSIYFDEVSPEWQKWQYADRSLFGRMPVSKICMDILRKAHIYVASKESTQWYDSHKSRPTDEHAKKLLEMLRGDFEYFEAPGDAIKEAEDRIKHYTEEQFTALDLLGENKRIIYKGPAGTGKTLLAIEAARRSIGQNKKTLFVCYNALLGKWIGRQLAKKHDDQPLLLTAGTIHQVLLSLAGVRVENPGDTLFWSDTLPDLVMDRILDGVIDAPIFEYLIVDEAQDILSEKYLDILDLLTEGGVAGGHWAFFGDFERQAIYSNNLDDYSEEIESLIQNRAPSSVRYPLRVNCRNDKSIAIGVELACALKPRYSRYLNSFGISGIETCFYSNSAEQVNLLRNNLYQLCKQFDENQIIVLSKKRDEDSAAHALIETTGFDRITSERGKKQNNNKTGFCTIHAFKGMEQPAVILTDIDDISGEKNEALLYVGMTRAKLRLVILMHENCRDLWRKTIEKSFLQ